jgi:hypothetical protein
MREFYCEYFDFRFLTVKQQRHFTACKRIVALCELRNWSERDFISKNMRWFKEKTKYRPVPSNFCGERAEERYENMLRAEGQTTEDVHIREQTKKRVETMPVSGVLQEQIEMRAEEDANQVMQEEEISIKKGKKVESGNRAAWLPISNEEHLENVRVRAKNEFMNKWRANKAEVERVCELIAGIESTGVVSKDVVNWINKNGYAEIPTDLVKVHENVIRAYR